MYKPSKNNGRIAGMLKILDTILIIESVKRNTTISQYPPSAITDAVNSFNAFISPIGEILSVPLSVIIPTTMPATVCKLIDQINMFFGCLEIKNSRKKHVKPYVSKISPCQKKIICNEQFTIKKISLRENTRLACRPFCSRRLYKI